MTRSIILVGLGGAIGSIFRFLTSVFITRYFQTVFPWGTFVVNVSGSLIIGIFLGLFEQHQLANPDLKFLLVTGFCGGFTTFSAFSAENIDLFKSGNSLMVFSYIASSILVCLFAVWIGLRLAKV